MLVNRVICLLLLKVFICWIVYFILNGLVSLRTYQLSGFSLSYFSVCDSLPEVGYIDRGKIVQSTKIKQLLQKIYEHTMDLLSYSGQIEFLSFDELVFLTVL